MHIQRVSTPSFELVGEPPIDIPLTMDQALLLEGAERASRLIDQGVLLPEHINYKLIAHFLIDKASTHVEWKDFFKKVLDKNLLNIEAADYPRHTALAVALTVPNPQFEVIESLMERGASLNVDVGRDPLIHFLLDRVRLDAKWYLLFVTVLAKMKNCEILDSKKRTLLAHALLQAVWEIVNLLLSQGAVVNISVGEKPMVHFLIDRYRTDAKWSEFLQKLLKLRKLDLETPHEGKTALAYAVEQGNIELIELLMKSEANLNISIGNQPLIHHLIQKSWKSLVHCALARRLNAEVRDSQGRTALAFALEQSEFEIAHALIDKKVQIDTNSVYKIIDNVGMEVGNQWFTILEKIKDSFDKRAVGKNGLTLAEQVRKACGHDHALMNRIKEILKIELSLPLVI